DWDASSRVRVEVRPFAPGEVVPGAVGRPELLVVGGGRVGRALLAIGKVLGFHLRFVTHGASDDGSDADERIVVGDAAEIGNLAIGPETYVVIAGHDREFSQAALRTLLSTDAPYLGMMGSRRHTGGLLEELRTSGQSKESLARVHTPVGLDLGAQTPEEIALSALAHVIAVRRGRPGSPLAENEGGGLLRGGNDVETDEALPRILIPREYPDAQIRDVHPDASLPSCDRQALL